MVKKLQLENSKNLNSCAGRKEPVAFGTLKASIIFTLLLCFNFVFIEAQTELVGNRGFESGDFTDWAEFPSAPGQQTVGTDNPSEGTFRANVNNVQLASASIIKSANRGVGIVNPGNSVTITFDARGATAVGGVVFAEFFSEVSGGGVSSAEILGGGPLALDPDPNVWKSFSFTTNTGPDVSGGVTLQFTVVTGGAAGSTANAFFDNVSMINNDEVLSIDDVSGDFGISTFPNPTASEWNINSNSEMTKVALFDLLGKQVLMVTPNSNELRIDASSFKTGVYFARIEGVNGTKTVKLIRQ